MTFGRKGCRRRSWRRDGPWLDRWRRWVLWSLTALVLAGAAACHRGEDSKPLVPKKVKADTFKVALQEISESRIFPGRVRAKREIVLSSKISGEVLEVAVEEGDRVCRGQTLLKLDERELSREIDGLRHDLERGRREKAALAARRTFAERHYRRFLRLYRVEAATREELERARSEYQALAQQEKGMAARLQAISSRIGQLQALSSYAVIRAPADALVVSRKVDAGSFANAGRPLLVLDDTEAGFWFQAAVDESLMRSAHLGVKMAVELPAVGVSLMAPLASVVKSIDATTRTFPVKLDLNGVAVPSGTFGRLFWPLGRIRALLVPQGALVRRGDLTAVYSVDSRRMIHFRLVKTGASFVRKPVAGREVLVPTSSGPEEGGGEEAGPVWVEILAGLRPGDEIVSSNLEQVSEGMVVQ